MVKVKRGLTPVTIVLETEEELDLFWHIVNYTAHSEEQYYPFDVYKSTFKQVMEFRADLWNRLKELGVSGQNKEDC